MSHTLAETYQYASQFIRLTPLTFATGPLGGRSGDPALSIGDWVRQFILSPPFAWRWNRVISAPITTVIAVQDYTYTTTAAGTMTNAASVSLTSNILTITSPAFGATSAFGANVTFTGFVAPTLTFLNNTSAKVLSSTATTLVCAYQHANVGATAAAGTELIFSYPLYPFGWLEKATITNAGISMELEPRLTLGSDSVANLPRQIAPVLDDNAGNVTFRLLPIPEKAYTLTLVYQKSSPSFSATSDTWDPIPDHMYHIYSQGVLAKAYEYLGDERWGGAMQLFIKSLIAFHGGLTESQVNLFMPDRTITQAGIQAALAKVQQAVAARGMQ
jgi:hypothetical protein